MRTTFLRPNDCNHAARIIKWCKRETTRLVTCSDCYRCQRSGQPSAPAERSNNGFVGSGVSKRSSIFRRLFYAQTGNRGFGVGRKLPILSRGCSSAIRSALVYYRRRGTKTREHLNLIEPRRTRWWASSVASMFHVGQPANAPIVNDARLLAAGWLGMRGTGASTFFLNAA